jgi:hypothetical protein
MQGRNQDLLEIHSSPEVESEEDYASAAGEIIDKDQGAAAGNASPSVNTAGNAPPENAAGNAPPENAAGNAPPGDAAGNIPPSENAAGNVPPSENAAGNVPPKNAAGNASPSTNLAGNASSSKKRKLGGDTEAGGESEDDTLLDLDQVAQEYNPILGEEDENNSPTPTVSFCSYGRRYGRR